MKFILSMIMLTSISVVSYPVQAVLIHHAEFSRDKFGISIGLNDIGPPSLPFSEGVEFGPNASVASLRNEFWEGRILHVWSGGENVLWMNSTHLVPTGGVEWSDNFNISPERDKYVTGPTLPIHWVARGGDRVLHPPKYEDRYRWMYGEFLRRDGGAQDRFAVLSGVHVSEPPILVLLSLGLIVLLFQKRRSDFKGVRKAERG